MSKTDVAADQQPFRSHGRGETQAEHRTRESKTSPSILTTAGKAVAERGGGKGWRPAGADMAGQPP
eukprot:10882196-Heterocapsa_arctica.AAC.1